MAARKGASTGSVETGREPDANSKKPWLTAGRVSREKPDREDRIGIDCPNEDRRPTICFYVDRMRWRPAESADKMRRSLVSFIKSVCNTRPSRSSNGNGSK